jgi:hypothetical protein
LNGIIIVFNQRNACLAAKLLKKRHGFALVVIVQKRNISSDCTAVEYIYCIYISIYIEKQLGVPNNATINIIGAAFFSGK